MKPWGEIYGLEFDRSLRNRWWKLGIWPSRRWRSPLGEIDIVARRRALLVFVEVKARDTLDDAAWSVTERQRARIVGAAEAWLARYPDPRIRDIRFDAMLVAPGRIPRHIVAAFDASR